MVSQRSICWAVPTAVPDRYAGVAPPVLFLTRQKENGPCTVQEKKRFAARKFPCSGKFGLHAGAVRIGIGINLPGFIRLCCTPAFGRAFRPQFGALGADPWMLIAWVSAFGPAAATWVIVLRWAHRAGRGGPPYGGCWRLRGQWRKPMQV